MDDSTRKRKREDKNQREESGDSTGRKEEPSLENTNEEMVVAASTSKVDPQMDTGDKTMGATLKKQRKIDPEAVKDEAEDSGGSRQTEHPSASNIVAGAVTNAIQDDQPEERAPAGREPNGNTRPLGVPGWIDIRCVDEPPSSSSDSEDGIEYDIEYSLEFESVFDEDNDDIEDGEESEDDECSAE